MNMFTKLTAAVICGLVLSACGGGGGGETPGTTMISVPPSTNPPPIATLIPGGPLTFSYEAQTPATDATGFLTLVNQEGARGYRYLGDAFFDGSGAGGLFGLSNYGNSLLDSANGGTYPATAGTASFSSIFVNDGTAPTYTYALLTDPDNTPDLVTQANTQGASGYRYEGRLMFYSAGNTSVAYYALYRKDGGSSATYTYAADPIPGSEADLLTQADGRGQSGYWLLYGLFPDNNNVTLSNLYVKNNASNATYTYDTLTPADLAGPGESQASVNAAFLAQLNSEGAKGYRAMGDTTVGSYPPSGVAAFIVSLYIKDQTQTSTFTYQSDTQQVTSTAFITQANSYGTQNYSYWGGIGLADGIVNCPAGGCSQPTSSPIGAFYIKASNCSGLLCMALNPL